MKEIYPLIHDNGQINYAKAYGTLSGLFIAIDQGTYSLKEALEIYNGLWHIINEQEELNRADISRN